MSLTNRVHNPDRRSVDVTPLIERRGGEERREPFVAPWRKRQIEQAGGPFVAVAWKDVAA